MLYRIDIDVDCQNLSCETLKIASDKISEVDCMFHLSDEWTKFNTVFVVFEDRSNRKVKVALDNGWCAVPDMFLADLGHVEVNLVANILDGSTIVEQLTSYKAVIVDINQKVNIKGDNCIVPTASVWEQSLSSEVRRLETIISTLLDRVDALESELSEMRSV